MRDASISQPIAKATVSAAGGFTSTQTDAQGNYVLTNVPAGLAFVLAVKTGFAMQTKSLNLVVGATETLHFELSVSPLLRILAVNNQGAVLRWPAALSDWILESTSSLSAGPQNWSGPTIQRVVIGEEMEALSPVTSAARFYRLRKP